VREEEEEVEEVKRERAACIEAGSGVEEWEVESREKRADEEDSSVVVCALPERRSGGLRRAAIEKSGRERGGVRVLYSPISQRRVTM